MNEKTFELIPFEENHDFSLSGKFAMDRNTLTCELSILPLSDSLQLVVPKFSTQQKKEGLWNSTCFEIFVKSGKSYVEWNFSPSGEWWSMDFSDYRHRLASKEHERTLPLKAEWTLNQTLSCAISIPVPTAPLQVGISCILDMGTKKTYWALAHPKDKPDFHDASCWQQC